MEYIQSKDNKTIKRMVALSNRKYRQKYDEYVLEGIRSIRDVAKTGAIKVIVIQDIDAIDKEKFLNTPLKESLILLLIILNNFMIICSFLKIF